MMKDTNYLIHEVLQTKFRTLLNDEKSLQNILFQVLVEGTAYLIGGYVRDVYEERTSRDLDIVVDIKKEHLKEIIDGESCGKKYNRFGGVKLMLQNIVVDIWSFDNNWAFKNNLVRLNEKEKLNSLAKGCFYNYDALVVNISNFSYNTKHYEVFHNERKLDILQRRAIYKNLNPTLEANILRAIFLKKEYNVDFTDHLKEYLYKKILYLNDIYGNAIDRLMIIKDNYPKYNTVSRDEIVGAFDEIKEIMPMSLF